MKSPYIVDPFGSEGGKHIPSRRKSKGEKKRLGQECTDVAGWKVTADREDSRKDWIGLYQP